VRRKQEKSGSVAVSSVGGSSEGSGDGGNIWEQEDEPVPNLVVARQAGGKTTSNVSQE
jgi:hypothetical protein